MPNQVAPGGGLWPQGAPADNALPPGSGTGNDGLPELPDGEVKQPGGLPELPQGESGEAGGLPELPDGETGGPGGFPVPPGGMGGNMGGAQMGGGFAGGQPQSGAPAQENGMAAPVLLGASAAVLALGLVIAFRFQPRGCTRRKKVKKQTQVPTGRR